jgi:hypothetical protein
MATRWTSRRKHRKGLLLLTCLTLWLTMRRLLPAGIPAGVGALYEFDTHEDFGAILMTEAPVVREAIYGSTALRRWCRDNTEALLSSWPEIKQNGLIIVTSTFATSHANINSWQEKGKKITIGFSGSTFGAYELAPSGSWYAATGAKGWSAFPSVVRHM